MDTLEITHQKGYMRQKFGPDGHLRFPEILLQFDISHELDPDVTTHLRNCARCWKLFNSTVSADADSITELLSEAQHSDDQFENLADLESMIYDELFANPANESKLFLIQAAVIDCNESERSYLLNYLDLLSQTTASTLAKARMLRFVINMSMRVYVAKKNDGTIIPLPVPMNPSFSNYEMQIAAGASDGNIARGFENLSNDWKCDITIKANGETELMLNCGEDTPPVLTCYTLPDIENRAPLDCRDLQWRRIIDGKPVYKLDGKQHHVLVFPGISEPLPIYTFDYIRNHTRR